MMTMLTEKICNANTASISKSTRAGAPLSIFPTTEEFSIGSYSVSTDLKQHYTSKGVISQFGDMRRFNTPTMIG